MRLMRPLVIVLLSAVLPVTFVAVPQAASPAAVLRWQDVEQVLTSHPAFQSALAAVGVAEGEVRAARQVPNPEFGMSLGHSRAEDGSEQRFIWDLDLTIPLEWPGRVVERSRAARHGVEAAHSDLQAAGLEIYRELRGLYLEIARDQEVTKALQESEDHLVKLSETVRLRVDQGEARPVELTRVEAELEELRLENDRSRRDARARRQQLNLWLGGRLPPEFTVEPDWQDLPGLPALEDALESARTNHPAVKGARARQAQAHSTAAAERYAALPEVGVGGFYEQEIDSRNAGGLLSIPLPFWNRNQGGIAKARAEAEKARADAALAARRIEEAVFATHARAAGALNALRGYESGILPKTRKALADLEILYQAGESGLIDVLDARQALIRAREGCTSVLFEYLNALLELKILTQGAAHV
jgi:cobalt-zinc-cadmium efflux system outer membrane protein